MRFSLPFTLLLVQLWSCDHRGISPLCGNGVLDNGEDCDGVQFAQLYPSRCADLGFNGPGSAACRPDCTIDYSPCREAGVCGDGVFTPGYEQCDGQDFGDTTCLSLGFDGGDLRCTAGCRTDAAACERCGDGVLQPEHGELVELDTETCAQQGFFGGLAITEDCRSPSFQFCGDFRLLTRGDGLTRPLILMEADDTIWLSGLVQGALPGFEHPGCPRMSAFWYDNGQECSHTVRSGFRTGGCDNRFLARIDSGQATRYLRQDDSAWPVVAMLDLGDHLARMQHWKDIDEPGSTVELIPKDGGPVVEHTVSTCAWSGAFRLVRLSESKIAAVYFYDEFHSSSLRLAVISVQPEEPVREYELVGPIEETLGTGTLNSYSAFLEVRAASETEVFLSLYLRSPSTRDLQPHFLHLSLAGGQPEVMTWAPCGPKEVHVIDHLHVSPEDRTFTTAWIAPGLSLVVTRWTFEGELLSTETTGIPWEYEYDTVLRADDGTYVLSGIVPLAAAPPGLADSPCQPGPGTSAFFHFAFGVKDGARTATRYFHSPAMSSLNYVTAENSACELDRRVYALNDRNLVIGGTYDRHDPFCTDREGITTYLNEPLHACAAYLIRMDRPGANLPLQE